MASHDWSNWLRPLDIDTLPLALVLIPGELPNGEIARVLLRPHGLEQAYVILSELNLEDRFFSRVRFRMRMYAYLHPDDVGPVEFALLSDGRLETRSDARGLEIGTHVPTVEHMSAENPIMAEVRIRAAKVQDSDFAGYGRARIVEYIPVSHA